MFAYVDSDADKFYQPGEPYSESYLNSIHLDPETNLTGVNLTLQDQSTGSFSGTISYDGTQQGLIATLALGLSPTPLNITLSPAPGFYRIDNLASGIYFVGSFMDSNADFIPQLSEPMGIYVDNYIIVKDGENTPDIDIVLDDSPEAAISGNVMASSGMEGKIA